MRFHSIKIRGLGPYVSETSVNLDALAGPLVAITGDNGAGKTTLLELLAGAVYRTTPTRGSLASLATARDAFVEVGITHKRRLNIRQLIDNVSGDGKTVLLDENMETFKVGGVPVVDSGKVSMFSDWAAKNFPAPDVLYASMFAPQGSLGFLSLKAAKRKAVILRVKGIEHYEALASLADKRASKAKAELATLVARIDDELRRGGDITAAKKAADEAEEELSTAEAVLKSSTEALRIAQEQAASARVEIEKNRQVRERHAEITERIQELTKKRDQVAAAIQNNRSLLADRKKIEEAVQRCVDIDAAGEKLRAEQMLLRQEMTALQEKRDALERERTSASQSMKAANERIRQADAVIKEKEAVDFAVDSLPELREALARAIELVAEARKDLEQLQSKQIAGEGERIQLLRTGLTDIRDLNEPGFETYGRARDVARRTIDADDGNLQAAAKWPAQLQYAQTALAEANQAESDCRKAVSEAEAKATRAPFIERAIQAREADRIAVDELDAAIGKLDVEDDAHSAGIASRRAAHAEKQKEIELLGEEWQSLQAARQHAERIVTAASRIEELEPQLTTHKSDLRKAEAELGKIVLPDEDPTLPGTTTLEAQLNLSRDESSAAHASLGAAKRALEIAERANIQLTRLREERAKVEMELADWLLLEESFGRKGIQALEVDAAGPELSELTNDLLQTCFGTRFSVTIETTRESGKRQIEECEVSVTDTQRGRTASGESFSGGERVIIGEAIALALSVMACRHAGVEAPTLVRDESAAALSPKYAPQYISMLRRAASIVGASKVLFVSHVPEVQELADSIVHISEKQEISVLR